MYRHVTNTTIQAFGVADGANSVTCMEFLESCSIDCAAIIRPPDNGPRGACKIRRREQDPDKSVM